MFLRGSFELGFTKLISALPWIHDSDGDLDISIVSDRLIQLYSISFQLLNMVEENTYPAERSNQASGPLKQIQVFGRRF